jgi:hypothetical protein
MAWPSDIADPPALLLLHVLGGVRPLVPHCSPRLGALAWGPPPAGCIRRNLRSCGEEPFVEVAGALLRLCRTTALVGGGPTKDVRLLALERGAGPVMLFAGVGPLQMRPVVSIHDLGDLGAVGAEYGPDTNQ